jgi:Cu-Zn family superoxide dismutase
MNKPLAIALGALVLLFSLSAGGDLHAAPAVATATFVDGEGKRLGTAKLIDTRAGVLIQLNLSGLPPGEHAFHVHEKGVCDAKDGFKGAGAHYGPGGHDHGYLVPSGPHAGDMPNQTVRTDGTLRADVLNPGVILGPGPNSLFDTDGSALVLHAKPDDYRSQPSGSAGDRIACAVVERSGNPGNGDANR